MMFHTTYLISNLSAASLRKQSTTGSDLWILRAISLSEHHPENIAVYNYPPQRYFPRGISGFLDKIGENKPTQRLSVFLGRVFRVEDIRGDRRLFIKQSDGQFRSRKILCSADGYCAG